MAIHSSRFTILAGAAFCAGMLSAGTTLAAPSIVAHRAVYDLGLDRASDRSGIASVSGRLVLEINGSKCEGFAINSRIVTRFATNEGKVNQTDIRSTSWESGDGQSFRFGTRQYLNDNLGEATKGRASREQGGKSVVAALTEPDEERFELPQGTVFPSEHNQRIMNAAFDGRNIDNSTVFDGTDGKKYYNATTFIGRARAPGAAGKSGGPDTEPGAKDLKSMRSWPVTISFFEIGKATGGEQTPSHEVSFVMYENGVSSNLLLNYGDFAIKGELSSLEVFTPTACP